MADSIHQQDPIVSQADLLPVPANDHPHERWANIYRNIGPNPRRQDSCPICREDITPNEEVNRHGPCGNCFHTQCLEMWFTNLSEIGPLQLLTCPFCRGGVQVKSTYDELLALADELVADIAGTVGVTFGNLSIFDPIERVFELRVARAIEKELDALWASGIIDVVVARERMETMGKVAFRRLVRSLHFRLREWVDEETSHLS